MTRRLLSLLGVALGATASAQVSESLVPTAPAPVPVPVTTKYAGTYHVASGTWTRRSKLQAFGVNNDVIYDNTAQSGYFYPTIGPLGANPLGTIIDEGGLPGTTNATPFTGTVDRNGYRVNSIQIGYCDFETVAGLSGWEFGFFESYSPCTNDQTPDHVVLVTGLPTNGCWVLDIDLSNSSQEFCIGADGGEADPGWNNDPSRDTFGWSHRYAGTGTANAGLLLAGDPGNTDPGWVVGQLPMTGNGTYYGGSSGCGQGTGYLTQDLFYAVGTAPFTGCLFFGGYRSSGACGLTSNPYSSFHMRMSADDAGCVPADTAGVGVSYCDSTPNSTGDMGRIRALGSDDSAADYTRLVADRLPLNRVGFFFTSETQGFTPMPGTSGGNVCVAGDIGRFNGATQVMSTGSTGRMELGSMDGLWNTARIPRGQAGNGYPAMAGISTNFQCWFTDPLFQGTASNFTNAIQVTWQ